MADTAGSLLIATRLTEADFVTKAMGPTSGVESLFDHQQITSRG